MRLSSAQKINLIRGICDGMAVLHSRNILHLDLKPPRCAPHDLVPGQNCLSYTCYEDLKAQIESIDEEEYKKILNSSYKWILSKASKRVTKKMLFESGIEL